METEERIWGLQERDLVTVTPKSLPTPPIDHITLAENGDDFLPSDDHCMLSLY